MRKGLYARRSLSVYGPIDYLLLRAIELSDQLSTVEGRRIGVCITHDYDDYFKIPLSENWIDWPTPHFLKRDCEMNNYLSKELGEAQMTDTSVSLALGRLDELWIVAVKDALHLTVKHRFRKDELPA